MMMVVMISLAMIPTIRGQVNREIDQFEDLLAVDSFDNEVFVVRPPPRKASSRKTSSKFGGGPVINQISTRDRFSKPSRSGGGAQVQHSKMNDDGSYSFRYETKDGVARQERGQPGGGVTGSWSYVGADGSWSYVG